MKRNSIHIACPNCGWDNDGDARLVQAYDSYFNGLEKSYALSTDEQFDEDSIFTECPVCGCDDNRYRWISAGQDLSGIETLIKKIRGGSYDERLEEFQNAIAFREQQRECATP